MASWALEAVACNANKTANDSTGIQLRLFKAILGAHM
jgi:hypothetical protein